MKNELYKILYKKGTYDWSKYLSHAVDNINNYPHSRMKLSANEITKRNEKEVYEKFYNKQIEKLKPPLYKINTFVRIREKKKIFERSYDTFFSPAVYKIVAVNKKYNTYKLENDKGKILERSFYEAEMLPTKFANEVLITKIYRYNKNKTKAYASLLGDEKKKVWVDLIKD